MTEQFSGKTICIIEDNDVIRKLFEILLRDRGGEIVSFDAGEQALNWISEHKTDIVLCDIMLPDISGEIVLKEIKELPNGDKITVIALTAIASQINREKFLAEGFDGYISKPINPETFADEILQIAQS